tara:strand:+ start:1776 stop:3176 length:1401 start_codon:yes stop_codon:yes gene_type:complete
MKKLFTFLLLIGATTLMAQIVPHALVKVTENGMDYWIIDTPQDLIWLASTTDLNADGGGNDFADLDVKWAANYRLGADITFPADPASYDWNNDGNPSNDAYGLPTISAEDYDAEPVLNPFTGHFNGQFYTIENAYKNYVNEDKGNAVVGLFGFVDGATIENLRMLNINFTSHTRQNAGVVAHQYTEVDNARPITLRRLWVEGVLHSPHYKSKEILNSAGIAGTLKLGEITECVVKITSTTDLAQQTKRQGGIVGSQLGGLIKNSYSISTITSFNHGGQIVGLQKEEATIENCYAAGVVTGDASKKFGSFAGQLSTDSTSSYWDIDLQTLAVGGDSGFAEVGLTTAQFATSSNFVGWDFANTWVIGDVNGVQRPYLQWQDLTPGTMLSVDNISLDVSLLRAYPNPVSSRLTIENAPVNAQFSMTNLLGQEQVSGTIEGTSMQLNVESYNKGIYILRVGDTSSKIVIE